MRLLHLATTAPVRYFVTVVFVAGATALTLLLPDEIERRNSTLFFGAVMLSAWWGGLGAGLVATALSAVAIGYFLMPSFHTFGLANDDWIRLSLFVAVAGLISYLNGARQQAEAHHAELLLQEKIGRARSEHSEWRTKVLADAAAVVARARDVESALGRLAHLVVPRFAGTCTVYVRSADGTLAGVTTAGAGAAHPPDVMTAVTRAVESGHATTIARTIAVPLVVGDATLGAVVFVAFGEQGYRDDDLVFAQGLAHHAALVLSRSRS